MTAIGPECPTSFEPLRATLRRHDLPPVAVQIVGLTTYRSYDLEHERHYRRAMAVLDTGTIVGLRRVEFEA